MQITVLKSKIAYGTITQKELFYVGSITIDEEIMQRANIRENEKVQISMKGYISEILKHVDMSKIKSNNVTCPHTSELFKVNNESKLLSDKQKKLGIEIYYVE